MNEYPQDKETLERWDKVFVWHPFTPMQHWLEEEAPIIVAGEGDHLIDIEGRRYIDGVSSLWATIHGHNHPKLNQAMIDQIHRISHSTFLGLSHPAAVSLAKRLVEISPIGLNKVFYSDSGATAVEVALKMAFQYHCQKPKPEPERSTFISLTGAYHGDTLGSVSVGGMELFHRTFRPLLFETIQTPQPYCFRCPLDQSYPDCDLACAAAAEEIIRGQGHRAAAVIVEPLIQGADGMITQPPGYLKRVYEAAKEAGLLFIADEVATGFGRTGTIFACQQADIAPDLLCLGKGLSGGYLPLASTVASEEVFSAFLAPQWEAKTFFHGHTFTANPVACAAGLANLEIFEEEQTIDRLQPKIALLGRLLKPLAARPYVGQVRQAGFMVGIELVADKKAKTPLDPKERLPQQITVAARRRGVITRPLGDVMTLVPPLSIEETNLELLVEAVAESMAEVLGG